MNADDRYRLADGVAIRAERFGGLVYHYHKRQLYFIHCHQLAALVGELTGGEPLGEAVQSFCRRRDLSPSQAEQILKSMSALHAIGVVVPVADTSP